MLGYLNAESLDSDGWYNTKDIVEQRGDAYRVVGRISEVINVGGLKFMASEVERIVLQFPGSNLLKLSQKIIRLLASMLNYLFKQKMNR